MQRSDKAGAVNCYVFKEDFALQGKAAGGAASSRMGQDVSVAAYKEWFYGCLARECAIRVLDSGISPEKLKALLVRPGSVLAVTNLINDRIPWHRVPRRELRLSLGTLMSPYHVRRARTLPRAQVELVSTDFQKERLERVLAACAPRMEVFSPRIDTEFFRLPSAAEKAASRTLAGVRPGTYHIVYAGRWLVSKGICQLIRALAMRPMKNCVVTIAGNVDEQQPAGHARAGHSHFEAYLRSEVLRYGARVDIRFSPGLPEQGLRRLLWSADLFAQPSAHPDENYGITCRQALACGVPVAVTLFGGLVPAGQAMPWGGVATYPTAGGVRFSLASLRALISQARHAALRMDPGTLHALVEKEQQECSVPAAISRAVHYLRSVPAEAQEDSAAYAHCVEKRLEKAFAGGRSAVSRLSPPLAPGGWVWGDLPLPREFLLTQALYSSLPSPEKVEQGSAWGGFFRVSLWKEERSVVESGYPGPRVKRYLPKDWDALVGCARQRPGKETVFMPRNRRQCALVQELVDWGYLVAE